MRALHGGRPERTREGVCRLGGAWSPGQIQLIPSLSFGGGDDARRCRTRAISSPSRSVEAPEPGPTSSGGRREPRSRAAGAARTSTFPFSARLVTAPQLARSASSSTGSISLVPCLSPCPRGAVDSDRAKCVVRGRGLIGRRPESPKTSAEPQSRTDRCLGPSAGGSSGVSEVAISGSVTLPGDAIPDDVPYVMSTYVHIGHSGHWGGWKSPVGSNVDILDIVLGHGAGMSRMSTKRSGWEGQAKGTPERSAVAADIEVRTEALQDLVRHRVPRP